MSDGIIVYWDAPSSKGVVLVGEEPYQFMSTSFFSSPSRFPVVGEPVEVVFQPGTTNLLAVRAKDGKTPGVEEIEGFHKRSGSVTSSDPLVSFLYLLMRDHLSVGAVEALVRDCRPEESKYTNGWLATYAKDVAERLKL